MALLGWAMLQACLLVDAGAFNATVAYFDHPAAAWLTAMVGYAGILSVSIELAAAPSMSRTTSSALSVAAFVGYSWHLLLLRWPWLIASATADSRLSVWAAALSSTRWGMPLPAFAELLGLATILTHALAGLFVHVRWQPRLARSRWMRTCAIALATGAYLAVSSALIVLATGRR